jgi:T5SS/PEP-CTERM-associated repeat protein
MVEIAVFEMAKSCKLNRSSGAGTRPNGEKTRRGRLLGTTAIAGVIAALSASPVHANDWTGTASSDWFTAGNWGGGVPTPADLFVIIENNGVPDAPIVGSSGAFALNLIVGNINGSGSLSVLNGGTLQTGTATIGGLGTGTLSVANGGAVSSNLLSVGDSATGSLIIGTGGTVTATGVMLARNSGSAGTIAIGAASGQAAAAPGTLNAPSVAFGSGTGTITFNHTSSNYVFAPTISGPGVVRVEAGTTIFTAANSYSHGTFIAGGTLEVTGPNGAISSGNDVNVGTLAGGTGTLNVTNGGKVTDGNGSIGAATGATGNATVTGSGSTWTTSLNFIMAAALSPFEMAAQSRGMCRTSVTMPA